MAIKSWIWGILLVVGAAGYGLLEWAVDDWSRDFFANTAATSPGSSNLDLQPITTAPTSDAAQRAVIKAAESLEGWEYINLEDQMGDRILRFKRTSPRLGIVDNILVTITNHEDSVMISATSESRNPWGDLGRNPRNLKQLLSKARSNLWRE